MTLLRNLVNLLLFICFLKATSWAGPTPVEKLFLQIASENAGLTGIEIRLSETTGESAEADVTDTELPSEEQWIHVVVNRSEGSWRIRNSFNLDHLGFKKWKGHLSEGAKGREAGEVLEILRQILAKTESPLIQRGRFEEILKENGFTLPISVLEQEPSFLWVSISLVALICIGVLGFYRGLDYEISDMGVYSRIPLVRTWKFQSKWNHDQIILKLADLRKRSGTQVQIFISRKFFDRDATKSAEAYFRQVNPSILVYINSRLLESAVVGVRSSSVHQQLKEFLETTSFSNAVISFIDTIEQQHRYSEEFNAAKEV